MAEGRDLPPATLDQPALTAGAWVQPGGVVIERSFADALGVHVSDRLTLNGRSFEIAGIGVDAAVPPYPHVCAGACDVLYRDSIATQPISQHQPGLIWVERTDAISLATPDVGLSYLLNIKLAHPGDAPAFAATYTQTPTAGPTLELRSWQNIAAAAAKLVNGPRTVLLVGTGLLVVLSLASAAVLVGGRMAEQTRRVGLLKAVGATPGTVAAVLLAEHLAVTLVAVAGGLAVGWAVAPLLSRPGAGLLGAAGAPPFTASTVAIVMAAALALAGLATLGPAIRAARTSTVNALADSARPPRRGGILVTLSARLPVPLLLGVRLAARRPYRVLLGVLSVAVTVAGIVAIVIEHARLGGASGMTDPQHQRMTQVLLVITVMLLVLAAVNALLITWATVLDSRHASALARALGATPQQITAGLSSSQLLSVIPGSILGVPLGIALLQAVTKSSDAYKRVPPWWLLVVVLGTWLVMAALTAVPASVGSHRSAAEVLQSELT
jgi:putative ABC transport system permease protein